MEIEAKPSSSSSPSLSFSSSHEAINPIASTNQRIHWIISPFTHREFHKISLKDKYSKKIFIKLLELYQKHQMQIRPNAVSSYLINNFDAVTIAV